MKLSNNRWLIATLAGAFAATTPMPAFAQDDDAARIRKLESEVRALQRRVFPGSDGRYFEPQIAGQAGNPAAPAPSTTALTDILARLDALESQIQRLTALGEENANAIRQLTERLAAAESDAALAASVAPATPRPTTPDNTRSTTDANLAAMGAGAAAVPASRPAASAAASRPSPERLAAVRAIAKPQTDDAGDDEYSYGFRLWEAGFYPEAAQQLTLFVEKYPRHSRTTYGRNLLGRAYLDDGKAREAAPWFLENYQADKQAARAGDSLLYLAESMIALGDTNRACIALAEFGDTYPALASGRLSEQYEANRRKVTCN